MPTAIPTLRTARLIVRPFDPDDAPAVERLAGDDAIARFIPTIPHPYPAGGGSKWIATHALSAEQDQRLELAVTLAHDGALVGALVLILGLWHANAELGYWIGRPHWGHGLATEAGHAAVDWAFGTLGVHRVYAHRLGPNEASGRVLEKLGMTREGTRRRHMRVRGALEDVVDYGVLREEWERSRR